MAKSRLRIFVFIFIIVAVLGGGAVVNYMNRAPVSDSELVKAVEQDQRPVKTLVVQPATMIERLESTGILRARRDVVITAEVAGEVKKVFKDLGDRCEKGELLVRLDGEVYRIAVAQTKAMVKQGKVAVDQGERDLARLRKLGEKAAATAQQIDSAEGGVASGAAALEQAKAGLRAAQRNLRETQLRCPFTGNIAQQMVELGQMVGPQTPVARLVDADSLELQISVTAAELSRIETEMAVGLEDPELPDRSYRGTVSRLGVAADEMTRTFPVEVEVDAAAEGLRAGQVVRAYLELARHEGALAVPVDAVMVVGGERSVFVARDGKAHRSSVVIGPEIDGQVIIASGLAAGDAVIVVGGDELADGAEIEIVNDGAAVQPPAPEPSPEPKPAAVAEQ
ncbi:MAG: efflux RND transporter periplasmic adaptor subunit [Deltaproteobacteria bacterium]|nr:efflux RND transporter periplasmic adaptor subunit [Deltaproteobacteria bacterium]